MIWINSLTNLSILNQGGSWEQKRPLINYYMREEEYVDKD